MIEFCVRAKVFCHFCLFIWLSFCFFFSYEVNVLAYFGGNEPWQKLNYKATGVADYRDAQAQIQFQCY